MSFMKVCAGSGLNLDTLELGEITPPTTYTVPTNTPILRANGEDAEIASIFIGVDDAESASFQDLMAELSSSRTNNEDVSATQSSAVRIANRVPTPFRTTNEENVVSLGAQLPMSYAAIVEERSTTLNAVVDPQMNVTSGWSWWYQLWSGFSAGSNR